MRVGIFTDTYYPEMNGVANSAFQLKNELEKRGNTVYVFTVSNPSVKEDEYHVYRLPSIPFALYKDRRVCYSFAGMWIEKVRQLQLDIIHTQTEFGVGHMGRAIAKALNLPLIHTYHTIYEDYTHCLKVPGNQKLKGLIRKLSEMVCNNADLVVVPTQKVQKLLLSYGVHKRIIVSPTGVNISKFNHYDPRVVEEIRKQYHLDQDDHVLISIGRVSQEKNLMELLCHIGEARKIDSHLKFLIVGDGPELENLKNKVIQNDLDDCVMFTGAVEWSQIQNYYAAGDVFVCASTSETQGLTYIESLAAGKPILARRDECLDGILSEGINGYGFDSEEEFLTGLGKLFENESYTQMQDDCRRSIQNVAVENFAESMEIIYQRMEQEKQVKEGKLYEKMHRMVG